MALIVAEPAKPNKDGLIRWSGVILFVVVTAVLVGVWSLVIDGLIERQIERSGTAIVGAKVELDRADLSVFPLGLTLMGLQVTNPEKPMSNSVEIAKIAMTLDPLNLLRRKIIVEEASVVGVRLDTPRKTSGEVKKTAQPQQKGGILPSFALPSMKIPEVKDILAAEELESVKLVETVKGEVAAQKEQVQKRLAALPDKAKFEDYKKRAASLKSAGKGGLGGIIGGASEVVALRNDITKDLTELQAAKQDIENAVALARKRADEAARAPQQDVERLKQKYAFGASGATQVSRLLFGEQVAGWVETVFRWHARLEPALQRMREQRGQAEVVKPVRGKGVDVRFPERAPLPDFLIRKTRATVELTAGLMNGEIRNITPDQDILGQPTTFQFKGEKLKDLTSVALNGTLNHMKPEAPRDSIAFRAHDYELPETPLAKTNDVAVTLAQARLDVGAQAEFVGSGVTAALEVKADGVKLVGQGSPDNQIATIIASALRDIHGFEVHAKVNGTRENYNVALSSNVDQIVGEVIAKQFSAQAARLQEELQRAISARIAGPLQELRQQAGGLDGLTAELQSRLNLGNEALASLATGGKGKGFKLPF